MCKSVRFSNKSTIFETGKRFKFSLKAHDIWYKEAEINKFRVNAKAECKIFLKDKSQSTLSPYSNNEKQQTRQYYCIRGLEQGIDAERKKRKIYANKIIIAAQNSMKANDLAVLSSNLSSWAAENAIKYAKDDMFEVFLIL